MEKIEYSHVALIDVKLYIADIGEGPEAVVFLHGFPEIWYMWRHQMIGVPMQGTAPSPWIAEAMGSPISLLTPSVEDHMMKTTNIHPVVNSRMRDEAGNRERSDAENRGSRARELDHCERKLDSYINNSIAVEGKG